MILKTGNNHISSRNQRLNSKGYTYVEVLLAVIIFATAIVGIFRTFIVSLDRMSLITHRLYANVELDNQISTIERNLKTLNTLPFDLDPTFQAQVGPKKIEFTKTTNISQLSELKDILELDLSLSWEEKGKTITISKSAYLAHFKNEE